MESLIFSALLLAETANPLTDLLVKVQSFGMVAIGLGFVIFVHELGHFLVAKACGVKCEKFYIGFDVPLNLGIIKIPGKLVHFQYGETEYGIGAIPLGGYVKMLGQDDNPENAVKEEERTKIRDEQGNVRLDPRSYQAKSVPARMAIISAGVIMNLIFGFIFATIAYKVGVKIQPAVIGTTAPGDPAWTNNLQPGDRIVQMGNGPRMEHMRFVKDMLLNLALYGEFDKPIKIAVRHADGSEEDIEMVPSDRHREKQDSNDLPRPTLGIGPSRSNIFGKVPAVLLPLMGRDLVEITSTDEDQRTQLDDFDDVRKLLASRATAEVALTSKVGPGDKLVAIDGEPVENFVDAQRILAAHPEKTLKLTIERAPPKDAEVNETATPEQYTLEVRPEPVIDYGLVMTASPITAVQKSSPAAEAGLVAGDRLVSFAGEPIGDPLAFPQRTLSKIGEEVEVEVERGSGKDASRVKATVKLRQPVQPVWSAFMSTMIAVETMGIAYEVRPIISEVREGSAAASALKTGDEIVKVQYQAAGKTHADLEKAITEKEPDAEITIDNKKNGWPSLIYSSSIARLPDTKLLVTAKRGEQVIEAELSGTPSKEIFLEDRNLPLRGLDEMHVAASWGEAAQLGFRELKERVTEVITVVSRLVTGRISLFQMGGPLTIFRVAGAEAERGVTDLLMFLTFLSANLAVLNFLPIPVLDGGHFLFLLYEGIRRKPVDANLQMKLSMAGLLLLLALMLFVTILDVQKLFT